MAFVFEGDFDLGAVELDLAVTENHVLRHDFCYAQLAKMLSGLLDHVLGGVFPTLGAAAPRSIAANGDRTDTVPLRWISLPCH